MTRPAPLLAALLALAACSGSASEPSRSVAEPPGSAAALAPPAPAAPARLAPPEETAPAPATGPALEASETAHDFGSVYEGALVRHVFTLASAGTADLVIEKIKPSCGCTAAEPVAIGADGERAPYETGTPLPPGARLELAVTFDSQGRLGRQAKSISVYCNDPRGVERLALTGKVEPFLNMIPNALQLGRLTRREKRTGTVNLTTRGGDPVVLSVDPKGLPPGLSMTLVAKNARADGKASQWEGTVEVDGARMHEGPFQFRIPVSSDIANPVPPSGEGVHPERLWLGATVWVQAEVAPLFACNPKEIYFGALAADTTASRGTRVNAYLGHPVPAAPEVRLEGPNGAALPQKERFHATVEPLPDVPGWTVELLVDGLPAGHGVFEGAVAIETGDPELPFLRVPFKGAVR